MVRKFAAVVAVAAVAACIFGCGDGTEKPSDDGASVKISFDAGSGAFDGGKKKVVVNAADGKAQAPSSPVADGHAFIGWYNGSDEFDPDKKYDKSVTYTAKYMSGDDSSVFDKLFDMDSVVTVDINMSDEQWKKLDADYDRFDHHKSPIYRLADNVTISIDNADYSYDFYYEEVGVRMKGNTSRRKFYGDNGFTANVHFKLSFGETFDDEDEYREDERKTWASDAAREARKDRMFGGMEKLDMKYNKSRDESYIRDLYAMSVFRYNGIAAPHATLCAVSALEKNSTRKNLGVYTLYETVDSAFLSRNFAGDDKGDLYKCSWGNSPTGADLTSSDGVVGVENELKNKFYAYDKKTNKKKDAQGNRDFSSMINFISALNEPNADCASLIDADYFAGFEAVNYLLGNPDCIRNNYNNYYIYFRGDGKAVFIPYDYDRCFGITADNWAPNNACLDLTPFDTRTSNGVQRNPLYVNLITGADSEFNAGVKSAYVGYLRDLAGGEAFTAAKFDSVKNVYKSHYAEYTKGALGTNSLAFDATDTGNIPFSEYVARKLEAVSDSIGIIVPSKS